MGFEHHLLVSNGFKLKELITCFFFLVVVVVVVVVVVWVLFGMTQLSGAKNNSAEHRL